MNLEADEYYVMDTCGRRGGGDEQKQNKLRAGDGGKASQKVTNGWEGLADCSFYFARYFYSGNSLSKLDLDFQTMNLWMLYSIISKIEFQNINFIKVFRNEIMWASKLKYLYLYFNLLVCGKILKQTF